MKKTLIEVLCAITVLSAAAPVHAQMRSNCYRSPHGDGSTYCTFTSERGGQKKIIISGSANSRQDAVIFTYTGSSFTPGSIFVDDEYGNKYRLVYFGSDKITLQDFNGNPPSTYYR